MLTTLAVPFSILLLVGVLPLFNELAGTDVGLSWGGYPWKIGTVLAVVAIVGLLAGSYPALPLSRFRPVDVLHGRTSVGSSGAVLRRMLVVFQFVASIVLIVGTVVVLRQIDYVQHKELGFDGMPGQGSFNGSRYIDKPFGEDRPPSPSPGPRSTPIS